MLLGELHDLGRRGQLDSPEADALREQMEVPWASLSDVQKQRVSGLSADLYALAGEELVTDPGPERDVAMQRVREAYELRDWDGLLAALRKTQDVWPAAVVSYMRARSWQELGRYAPAYWFFDHAHRLDPTDFHYQLLALDALLRRGDLDQVVTQSLALLETADAPKQLVFGASRVLHDCARQLPREQASILYRRVAAALLPALAEYERNGETALPSLAIAARINLAMALERLGDDGDARRAYDAAVASHPDSDEVLMARALFLLRIDRSAGLRDLHTLVHRNTALAHPYYFLAHEALLAKQFRSCLDLSDRGLRLATRSHMQANLLEWIAISLYELGQSSTLVRSYFQSAARLDPLNENIRRNLELYDSAQAGTVATPFDVSNAMLSDDAMDDLQSRLQPAA
jgi:tetratricopeptide (TPR) repeat protein